MIDPYTALLGGAMSSMSAGPAGPSDAKSFGSVGGAAYDGSGWNITFGNDSAIKTDRTQVTQPEWQKYLPYVVVAVVGLVAWRALKK